MPAVDARRPTIDLRTVAAFDLGAISLKPSLRQAVFNGVVEVLEPRVMQVLIALAQAGGAVLSRDDLIALCWDGRVVSDDAINRTIAKLRELSARLGQPFRIETIAKVGYRLLPTDASRAPSPPPETKAPPAAQAESDRAASPPPQIWSRRTAILTGVGAFGVAAGVSVLFGMRSDPRADRVANLIAQSEQMMRLGLPQEDAQGVGFLEEAVAIALRNVLAWGRLALARQALAEYAPPERAGQAVQGVQDAARQALALNPRQVDALAALALLPPAFGDWLNAERRMAEVLRVDPQHFPTMNARDFFFMSVGRVEEASSNRIAYAALEPLHAVHQFRMIYAHWNMGDLAAADQTGERALRLWPKRPGCWQARFVVFALTGRPARALDLVEDDALRPDMPEPMLETFRLIARALETRAARDVAQASTRLLQSLQ